MSLVKNIEETAKENLKESGLRCTEARLSIYLEFLKKNKPLSILHFKKQKKFSSFDESSLYRNFKKLEETGLIQSVPGSADFQFYEVQQSEHQHHHHHITCTKCKVTTCLDDCSVEKQLKKMALGAGFDLKGHKLELYGLCTKCSTQVD